MSSLIQLLFRIIVDWEMFDVEHSVGCTADYVMMVESQNDEDHGQPGDTQVGTFEKICGHFGANLTL